MIGARICSTWGLWKGCTLNWAFDVLLGLLCGQPHKALSAKRERDTAHVHQ